MIIGISGRMQSGKSTVAEYLHKRIDGSARIPIAFKLKTIVQECLGASSRQVYGTDEEKNTLTPAGISGRQALQDVGAAMRRIWPNCWVWAWEQEVIGLWAEQGVRPIIVEDVRYMNEVMIIKKMGGIVIRLTRGQANASHESEVDLDGFRGFDALLDNRNMSISEMCSEAMSICREKGVV